MATAGNVCRTSPPCRKYGRSYLHQFRCCLQSPTEPCVAANWNENGLVAKMPSSSERAAQNLLLYWPFVCRWLFTFAPRIKGRRPITQGRCTALRARMSDRRNVHSNLPLSLSWFAAFHIHCNVNTETAAGSHLFVTIVRA